METQAVYAASLDPITYGHLNVIERMAPLYDKLIVVVAVDSRKSYTFSPEQRVSMAEAATAHLPNVLIRMCSGQYVVKFAASIGAQVVIRGLRNFSDLEAEQVLAEENRKICPEIETIWVPCLTTLMNVSSSMVKGHIGVDPSWEKQVARSVPAPVVAELRKIYVPIMARKHWATLMSKLGNPRWSEITLKDLLERHTEPHRAYHNLKHIVDMLDELELVGENIPVTLAIWFHDAVYIPMNNHNEEQSAEVARRVLNEFGLLHLVEQVCTLILATEHRDVPTNHPEAKLLVDLDLAILGKPEKEFDAYESAIRAEHIDVPDIAYAAGRSTILRSFLERSSIYSTDFFHRKYEEMARKNLRRSIEQLQK